MINKPEINQVADAIPEATIIKEIDSGGFKVVYEAIINDKHEALKLAKIPSDPNDSEIRDENISRIHREIGILKECNCLYLVKLGSLTPKQYTVAGNDYIVYSEELINGDSLRKLISESYKPSCEEIVRLCICLLNVVFELSSKNIIHRDIKPANIIKTTDPKRPYILLDLGIAFKLGGTQLTKDSFKIPGTLFYIAPEMLDLGFRQNINYRADIYTIGLSLYEFASGINPYIQRNEEQWSTFYRIKTQKPEPLNKLRDDLPRPLCDLINQLMKKMPALRPANITLLIGRMEKFL